MTDSPLLPEPSLAHYLECPTGSRLHVVHRAGELTEIGLRTTTPRTDGSYTSASAYADVEDGLALAAAIVHAVDPSGRHRVIDLGEPLPEVITTITGGERVLEVSDEEGSLTLTDDDLDLEQTMRVLRRRLAALEAVADATRRHGSGQVDEVAQYLRDLMEISEQESQWRAVELLDRLQGAGSTLVATEAAAVAL